MAESKEVWSLKVDKKGAVWLVGEVDYTATPKLRKSLIAFLEKTQGDVHFNLSKLTYLDSSGLAVIIEARRILTDSERKLVIDAITPEVKKIFDLTQVSKLFNL